MPRILGILRDNNRKTIVSTELIINSKASEVAIALLEDGRLVEYQTQDARNDFAVGDIYIGKVRKVIPGLNSAFVDILDGFKMEPNIEKDGKIGNIITQGTPVLVQITKEAISTKGPRLTSEVSIPGRMLVLVPFNDKVAISQKIKRRDERDRLRMGLKT